jgi:hypothetical protein
VEVVEIHVENTGLEFLERLLVHTEGVCRNIWVGFLGDGF